MEHIKNFLLIPSKTGLMALVLFFVVVFNISDIFAEPAPYNKNKGLLYFLEKVEPNLYLPIELLIVKQK